MIPILYERDEIYFSSNGLHRLYDCVRCEVTEERNGVYECQLDYPVDGPHFDDIICGRIIGVEHDSTGDIQPFDIYGYSKPINGVVTFMAHHISYRQREMTVYPTNINNLTAAFTAMASAIPSNPFQYVTDISSENYVPCANGTPITVREMLGGIEGSLLDAYRIEYKWDKFMVYALSQRGEQKEFTVRYGINMVDYTEDTDFSETYNAVLPFWSGDDGNGNQVIVRGQMVNPGFPGLGNRTICVPLDLSDKFETQPTTTQLEAAAESYINNNSPYLPSQTITINFIEIKDTALGMELANLQTFGLCDSIYVRFPRYGVEGSYKIVKVVWDVLLERYIEMELGNLSTTLSEALGL